MLYEFTHIFAEPRRSSKRNHMSHGMSCDDPGADEVNPVIDQNGNLEAVLPDDDCSESWRFLTKSILHLWQIQKQSLSQAQNPFRMFSVPSKQYFPGRPPAGPSLNKLPSSSPRQPGNSIIFLIQRTNYYLTDLTLAQYPT